MKKFLFITFVIFSMSINAQVDSVYYGTKSMDTSIVKKPKKRHDWIKKITYGGNFGLLFGSYTYINVSPTIGYNFFKNFNAGIGLIYNYFSINYGAQYGRISQTVYGHRTYARYMVTQNIFLLGQYDRLLQPNFYNISNPDQKIWVDYGMAGGGYRLLLGNKSALVTSIMYNFTPSPLSIYQNPIIQVGFIGSF